MSEQTTWKSCPDHRHQLPAEAHDEYGWLRDGLWTCAACGAVLHVLNLHVMEYPPEGVELPAWPRLPDGMKPGIDLTSR